MSLRLIAVDLDGTLIGGTNEKYGILLEGLEALRRAVAMKYLIAIVTGRDIDFIKRLFVRQGFRWADEGWPHMIISEECYIYRLIGGQYVSDSDWNDHIRHTERAYFEFIRKGIDQLIESDLSRLDSGVFRRKDEIEEMRGYVEIRFTNPMCAHAGEQVIRRWLEYQSLSYSTIRNWSDIYIRHSTIGKGILLSKLCQEFGVLATHVLAIGDSCNDLSMLDGRFGFIGAAPGNAEDEVKQALILNGGYVATAGYGKGVAEAIYRLLR